jgi:hypothetical protein
MERKGIKGGTHTRGLSMVALASSHATGALSN